MMNWIERAKHEFSKSNSQVTAVADERNAMAVTAVPQPGKPENMQRSIGSNGSLQVPMATEEETAIRAWLAHIEDRPNNNRTGIERLSLQYRNANLVP